MKKLLDEFKEFINRGNVMDLAVAVIMGAAFTAIINSINVDLVTPLISLLTFGVDFSSFSFTLGQGDNAAVFSYGKFLQAVLNFLIVSFVVFFMVKALNKVAHNKEEPATQECPYCKSKIALDALRCPQCTTVLDESKVPKDIR